MATPNRSPNARPNRSVRSRAASRMRAIALHLRAGPARARDPTLRVAVNLASLLIDFDGTVCPQDVSEELLDAFGDGDWRRYDEAVDRAEMGLRQAAEKQAAMLRADRDEMLGYALERFAVDPTF